MDEDELAEYRAKHRQAYLARKYANLQKGPGPSQESSATHSSVTRTVPTSAPGGKYVPTPAPLLAAGSNAAGSRQLGSASLKEQPAVLPKFTNSSRTPLLPSMRPSPPASVGTTLRSVPALNSHPRNVVPQDMHYTHGSVLRSNERMTDEELARKLQEAEDEKLARRLAESEGLEKVGDSSFTGSVMHTERDTGGPVSPSAPLLTRNLLGFEQPTSSRLTPQMTVIENVRNTLRRYPLSPVSSSNRSTPMNVSEMSEEEQIRWAMEESRREYESRR